MRPLAMIAAMNPNRVIGARGDLPWMCPEDLAHFKKTTMFHPVVMGRRTWESIGCDKLPKRPNFVMTKSLSYRTPIDVPTLHSAEQIFELTRKFDRVPFVIGGGEIYRLFLPLATTLYLSIVPWEGVGDTTFPQLDASEWRMRSELISGRTGVQYRVYERTRG